MTTNEDRRQLLSTVERHFEGYVASIIMFAYTAIILFTIITRTLNLDVNTTWVQAVDIGGFVWLGWLAVAYAIRHDGHLRFTFFRERFSSRANYVVYWAEWLSWLAFAGVIFWFSLPILELRMSSGTTIVGTPIPRYLTYLAIPAGFGLILVRLGQQAVIVTRRYLDGDELTLESGFDDAESV